MANQVDRAGLKQKWSAGKETIDSSLLFQ